MIGGVRVWVRVSQGARVMVMDIVKDLPKVSKVCTDTNPRAGCRKEEEEEEEEEVEEEGEEEEEEEENKN